MVPETVVVFVVTSGEDRPERLRIEELDSEESRETYPVEDVDERFGSEEALIDAFKISASK
jgi:hypothetical protein